MSGHREPEILAMTKQMGASSFLQKPFESSRLLAEVKSLIH